MGSGYVTTKPFSIGNYTFTKGYELDEDRIESQMCDLDCPFLGDCLGYLFLERHVHLCIRGALHSGKLKVKKKKYIIEY